MSNVAIEQVSAFQNFLISYTNLREGKMIRRLSIDITRYTLWFSRDYADIINNIRHKVALDYLMSLQKAEVSIEFIDIENIEGMRESLEKVYVQILVSSGERAAEFMNIGFSFNLVRDEYIEAARKFSGDLITNISNDTKLIVKDTITRGIEEGWGAPKIGRALENYVGMNQRQLIALNKLEEKLKRCGITGIDLERQVSNEAVKKRRYRNLMISRTEAARARSEGALEVYKKDGLEKVIYITASNPCPICSPWESRVLTLHEAEGLIPQHGNCLCMWIPYTENIEESIR